MCALFPDIERNNLCKLEVTLKVKEMKDSKA